MNKLYLFISYDFFSHDHATTNDIYSHVHDKSQATSCRNHTKKHQNHGYVHYEEHICMKVATIDTNQILYAHIV